MAMVGPYLTGKIDHVRNFSTQDFDLACGCIDTMLFKRNTSKNAITAQYVMFYSEKCNCLELWKYRWGMHN